MKQILLIKIHPQVVAVILGRSLVERLDALLGSALGDSGMSVRTVNCLETNKVATIGELAQMTQEELMKIPNFGEMTLSECIDHLDRLKVPHPEWSLSRKQMKKKS